MYSINSLSKESAYHLAKLPAKVDISRAMCKQLKKQLKWVLPYTTANTKVLIASLLHYMR